VKHTLRASIVFLLFLAALMAAWEGIVELRLWPPYVLPPPIVTRDPQHPSVSRYIAQAIGDGSLPEAAVITVKRLLCGYAIGIFLGLPLGLLTARFLFAEQTLGKVALGLQTLPSVCWVPLALLWFGQTESAMLFVVSMGSVWSILIASDNGVRNVPPIFARAARTMGSRGFHTWLKVILPASLPFIVSGMKQGWAFAWRSLMAAEIYVTIITGSGLGQLLHYGRERQSMEQVVAIMIVIVAIGLLADRLLFSPWERFLHHRWGTAKS
jgi:NitT/TauT family transport system permease protein